jgi:hypothetical protein
VKSALRCALLLSLATIVAAPGPSALAASSKPYKVPKKAPRISIEPASHDFGPLPPLRTVQKEFTIRNFGKKDLVILGVSTTCGCTVAKMETTVVKPGKTTAMKVNLETRDASGRLARSVLVRSNDPVRSVFEVKVQATVVPPAAK